jgi:hypothetical protein
MTRSSETSAIVRLAPSVDGGFLMLTARTGLIRKGGNGSTPGVR